MPKQYVTLIITELFITASLKLYAALGVAHILDKPDFLIDFLTNRQLLVVSAGVELVVIYLLCRAATVTRQFAIAAWLGTVFATYRLGLWVSGYEGPCNCLGHMTDQLHIDPAKADAAMILVLLTLLLPGYWRALRFLVNQAFTAKPTYNEHFGV